MTRILSVFIVALFTSLSAGLVSEAQSDSINLGEIRVVNALLGYGMVDVYLDGQIIAYDLMPQQATAYFAVPVGQHIIAVRLPDADPLSPPIADVLLDLVPNQSKTAVVYQKHFAQVGDDEQTYVPPLAQSGAFMVLDDDRSPAEIGRTRLTAAHLFPARPGRLSVAYTNRASLLHEIAPEKPYGTIDISAGNYALTVVDAESPGLDIIERIGQLSFHANTLYTLFIVPDQPPPQPRPGQRLEILPGFVSNNPRVFVISAGLDRPADGLLLRVIHAAYDTAVLDLYINERLVVPRMTYGQYTDYLGISGYSHTITLRRRDASPTSQPLATAILNITEENQEQTHWTLLLLNTNTQTVSALNLVAQPGTQTEDTPSQIVNTPGGPLVMTLLPDNIAQTQRGRARLRLIHAVDGALDINLRTPALPSPQPAQPAETAPRPPPPPSPPVTLVNPVVYGAEANEGETPGGIYSVLDFLVGGTTSLLALTDKPIIEGMVYTFVLIGQPAGEPPVQALQIEDYGRGIPRERLYRGLVSATVEVVNIRERDSLQSSVQGQVPNNTQVDVLGRNADGSWVLIRYSAVGQQRIREGWINAPLIRVTRLGDPVNVLSLPLVQR